MDLIEKQVPRYLLIGDGRVSRHFQHYFSLLKIPFKIWRRQDPPEILAVQLSNASHVLLLIRDQAIEAWIDQYSHSHTALLIHFSGSLLSERAYGAHPLMTFSENLYTLEEYLQIPFVIDHHAPDFQNLLPGLNNAHFRLHTHLKAKYHALCVMSGNFSCLLWKKLFYHFQEEFNLPESIAYPYLSRQMHNLMLDSKTALTGPLVRNDQLTINKNLAALAQDPFQTVYESFLASYQQSPEIFK